MRDYDHPGHVIVVSNGDIGFTAANFPADLATVTAVGGTELARAHTPGGWTEQSGTTRRSSGPAAVAARRMFQAFLAA